MRTTTFSTLLAVLATAVVRAQPSPPAQGIQLGNTDIINGYDIRFPLTVTQCEPVFIYYDTTARGAGTVSIGFVAAEQYNPMFLEIAIPSGTGYIEWFCNIPAGYSFGVWGYHAYYLVVQPGSSSGCLTDITTTYARASYMTTVFQSYTSNSPANAGPSMMPVLHGYVYPFFFALSSALTIFSLARQFPSSLVPSQQLRSSTNHNFIFRIVQAYPHLLFVVRT